ARGGRDARLPRQGYPAVPLPRLAERLRQRPAPVAGDARCWHAADSHHHLGTARSGRPTIQRPASWRARPTIGPATIGHLAPETLLPPSRCSVASVNDALAHERLAGVLELIDRWGELYNRRWGNRGQNEDPGLASQVDALVDEVRGRTKLARDVINAMGE